MDENYSKLVVSQDRWSFIALTRFILALAVVINHLPVTDPSTTSWASYLGGNGAVAGFLFISGFSIAASLFRERECFYARRVWRIAPVYYVGLALALLVDPTSYSYPRWLWFALMLQTFATPGIGGAFTPAWSIAIEWWLYMVSPLLRQKYLVGLSLFLAVPSLVFLGQYGWVAHRYASGIPFVVCSWFWIAGFAAFYHRRRSLICLYGFLTVVALEIGPGPKLLGLSNAAAALLGLWSIYSVPRFKLGDWANRLGDMSYPLYLTHFSLFFLLKLPWPISLLIALATSALIN